MVRVAELTELEDRRDSRRRGRGSPYPRTRGGPNRTHHERPREKLRDAKRVRRAVFTAREREDHAGGPPATATARPRTPWRSLPVGPRPYREVRGRGHTRPARLARHDPDVKRSAICVASAVRPPTRTVSIIASAAKGAKYTATYGRGERAPAAVSATSERIDQDHLAPRATPRSHSARGTARGTPAIRPDQSKSPSAPRQSLPSLRDRGREASRPVGTHFLAGGRPPSPAVTAPAPG